MSCHTFFGMGINQIYDKSYSLDVRLGLGRLKLFCICSADVRRGRVMMAAGVLAMMPTGVHAVTSRGSPLAPC